MGHVGHEIDAHPFEFLQPRDVMEDEHGLRLLSRGAFDRRDRHVQDAGRKGPQGNLPMNGLFASQEPVQGILQFNIPHDLDGRLFHDVGIIPADHFRHAPVEAFDPALAVQDHDPLGHPGKGGAKLPLLLVGRPDFFPKHRHHLVDVPGELTDFIARADQDRAGQVALPDPLGKISHLPDGSDQPHGKDHRQEHGADDHQQQHLEHPVPELFNGGVDLGKGPRQAEVARHDRTVTARQGHVEAVLFDRTAVAGSRPLALDAGFLNFGTVQMVVHADQIGIRIGQDPALGIDQRDPGAGAFGQGCSLPDDLPVGHEEHDPRLGRHVVLHPACQAGPELTLDEESGNEDGQDADRHVGAEQFVEKADVHSRQLRKTALGRFIPSARRPADDGRSVPSPCR